MPAAGSQKRIKFKWHTGSFSNGTEDDARIHYLVHLAGGNSQDDFQMANFTVDVEDTGPRIQIETGTKEKPQVWHVILDTGSIVPWVGGKTQKYVARATPQTCDFAGKKLKLKYGKGSQTVHLVNDRLVVGKDNNLEIPSQTIGHTGSEPPDYEWKVDGFLGIGPRAMVKATTEKQFPPNGLNIIPFYDHYFQINSIQPESHKMSVYLPLAGNEEGFFTLGEVQQYDPANAMEGAPTAAMHWIAQTKADHAKRYYGFDTKIFVGKPAETNAEKLTPICHQNTDVQPEIVAITDTGTTRILLDEDLFHDYTSKVAPKCITKHPGTSYYRIKRENIPKMESVFFQIHDIKNNKSELLEFVPNAQFLPDAVAEKIEDYDKSFKYLVFRPVELAGKVKNLGCILGYYALARYYWAVDFGTGSQGFAPTDHTHSQI
ncbi:acid protease [Rickenella mellea]|uniref:Acid protease n=1 Tax=Rickenella mellea TaxID=50990 RepID=A0A4Y7Q037_9AGAM|nr:acid protease [Rickenella mellea]